MASAHIEIQDLLAALRTNPDMPVQFHVDDSSINPGYHVTEVRHAVINSVDCGKHSDIEQWNELTIQLLDGSSNSTQGHMQAKKFAGIIQKSIERLEIDSPTRLFFEFSPNNSPIRKLNIASIDVVDQSIAVWLGNEKAVCKPFERSKIARAAAVLSGGAIGPSQVGCCGSSNDEPRKGGCC